MSNTWINNGLQADTRVLITGASSGIGKASALRLHQAGAKVTAVARREEAMAELVQAGIDVRTLDLSDRDAQRDLITQLQPDIVVCNAGTAHQGDLADGSSEAHDRMIAINVTAVLDLLRDALPGMKKRGTGHVVLLGSIAGHFTLPGMPVYSATKAAIAAISNQLRMELLDTDIRVTEIAPGRVETEIFGRAINDLEKAAKTFFDGYECLQADDIAETIVWALTAPAHVNIAQITVLPTRQAPGGLSFAVRK